MKISSYFLSLLFVLIYCQGNAQIKNTPISLGNSYTLPSVYLGEERVINIMLPEGYEESDSIAYPVIYILDGGRDEDFLSIAGIVHFNSKSWVGRIPPSIVVGIEGNTRRRDFTFPVSNTDFIEKEGFQKSSFPEYGGSEKYIQFLAKELLPFIDSMLNTQANRTIIGESLAGLLATEILIKHTDLFNKYIIISPSLWWGEQLLIQSASKLINKKSTNKTFVYLGVPQKEEDIKMYEEAETLYQQLKTKKNLQIEFDYLPDERHATVLHQAVYNAFKKMQRVN